MPWFKTWGKLLLLCLLLGIALHQVIKFSQTSHGKKHQVRHLAQLQGESHRPTESDPAARTYKVPTARELQADSTTMHPAFGLADGRKSAVIVKDKVTVLYAGKNGHYPAPGRVNGLPVEFVLDTEADNVTISVDTAVKAGIRLCAPVTMHAEVGHATVCKAVIPTIGFGGYLVSNVEVTISDEISGHPLLGRNVLRLFNIRQHGSRLFFSPVS